MIKLILKLKETQLDEFNLEKSMINIGRSQEYAARRLLNPLLGWAFRSGSG
jgi:hypothetical protein